MKDSDDSHVVTRPGWTLGVALLILALLLWGMNVVLYAWSATVYRTSSWLCLVAFTTAMSMLVVPGRPTRLPAQASGEEPLLLLGDFGPLPVGVWLVGAGMGVWLAMSVPVAWLFAPWAA